METKVKERPIIFSAPMVRALLAGTKIQTRRIIKVQPDDERYRISTLMSTTGDRRNEGRHFWGRYSAIGNSLLSRSEGYFPCPYGQPGDRLWVRETSLISPKNFADYTDYSYFDTEGHGRIVQHLATSPNRKAATDLGVTKATPSIFMPRWASRILLEITAVRCERLQDITEADAVNEGVNVVNIGKTKGVEYENYLDEDFFEYFAKDSYATLWEKINGLRSWATNPWVWVVEFKQIAA